MRKGFDQWFGTGFPKNIKSSEKHRPVTRNIKHPAAHTSNAAILKSEPRRTNAPKVQLQSVLITRRASVVPGQSIAFSGTCSNPKALCWVNPNVFALENSLGAGDTPIGDIVGPNYYQ